MSYIEFPKTLYKGGDSASEDAVVVRNAEEEAAAEGNGYAALPARPPDTPEVLKSLPSYLEYPKHVYRGEGDARESVVVKSADEEAAALEDGYAPLLAAGEIVDDAPPAHEKKPKKPKK